MVADSMAVEQVTLCLSRVREGFFLDSSTMGERFRCVNSMWPSLFPRENRRSFENRLFAFPKLTTGPLASKSKGFIIRKSKRLQSNQSNTFQTKHFNNYEALRLRPSPYRRHGFHDASSRRSPINVSFRPSRRVGSDQGRHGGH